ncbi:hypothetical protein OH492_10980 [Vibrio chagasii]|nr:hypothetical protein [Vibrio chagasii]
MVGLDHAIEKWIMVKCGMRRAMLYKAISKWSAPQQGCRFREVAAITAAVPAMENSPMVSGFLVSTRAPWPASLPP